MIEKKRYTKARRHTVKRSSRTSGGGGSNVGGEIRGDLSACSRRSQSADQRIGSRWTKSNLLVQAGGRRERERERGCCAQTCIASSSANAGACGDGDGGRRQERMQHRSGRERENS